MRQWTVVIPWKLRDFYFSSIDTDKVMYCGHQIFSGKMDLESKFIWGYFFKKIIHMVL